MDTTPVNGGKSKSRRLKLPDAEMARIYHQIFHDKVSIIKVAEEHGVAQKTARQWQKCWEKYGVPWEVTGKRVGRPPKARPEGQPYVPLPPRSHEPKFSKSGKQIGRPRKVHHVYGHCSLDEKQMGGKIQDTLRIDPDGLLPMHFEMDIDVSFFRSFFIEYPYTSPPIPAPAVFDESSPVVVLELDNTQAGELLGKAKVQGRHKFSSLKLAKLCIVFRPPKGKATAYMSPEGKSNLSAPPTDTPDAAPRQRPAWPFDTPTSAPSGNGPSSSFNTSQQQQATPTVKQSAPDQR